MPHRAPAGLPLRAWDRCEDVCEHETQLVAGLIETHDRVLDAVVGMPYLFGHSIEQGKDAAVFPVQEFWLDVGRKGDYRRVKE